jgi:multisubunit Na+/H+ antiporter MnhG subunit
MTCDFRHERGFRFMDQLMQWLFAPAIMISLVCSATYSIKSRRAKDTYQRGIFGAKMNISMGAMLVFIALVQLFLSAESTLRIVIGAIFLVLGVFNLFAGLRNLSLFRAAKAKSRA